MAPTLERLYSFVRPIADLLYWRHCGPAMAFRRQVSARCSQELLYSGVNRLLSRFSHRGKRGPHIFGGVARIPANAHAAAVPTVQADRSAGGRFSPLRRRACSIRPGLGPVCRVAPVCRARVPETRNSHFLASHMGTETSGAGGPGAIQPQAAQSQIQEKCSPIAAGAQDCRQRRLSQSPARLLVRAQHRRTGIYWNSRDTQSPTVIRRGGKVMISLQVVCGKHASLHAYCCGILP